MERETTTTVERLDDPRCRRAMAYINERLGEEISVARLAQVAGLSPYHFLRVFKRATGRSPHRYIIEQRVNRAADLLRDPRRTIVEVAYEVGFCSQSHLTVVFRRFMKTTPAAYRDEMLRLDGMMRAERATG
ncbi:helix-turn-helix domain-containing protein [Aquisphaera giovannonii]|uniref:helix-turn-helix domain-containing protein n=1 Tax=Aquisphaera giovannonii TaxID=406548 RepID=UPI0011E0694C|nr:AraC family transcriptional regulator [Aquisphaera giovannonii]